MSWSAHSPVFVVYELYALFRINNKEAFMPKYKYRAISESGKISAGEAFANRKDELVDELTARGLFVTKISRLWLTTHYRKANTEELLLFVKELKVLVRSGLSIPDSLEVTINGRNTPLGSVLDQIRIDLLRGTRLSDAFNKYTNVFDILFTNAIESGERSGELVNALENYEALLEKKLMLQRKVRQALLYPFFIIFIIIAIVFVIFEYSLPRFIEIYASLDAELPSATKILIDISRNIGPISLVAVVAGLLLWRLTASLRHGKKTSLYLDKLIVRLPVVGAIQQSYLVALFSRTLSSILSNGTPVVEALKHAAGILPNKYYSEVLLSLSTRVSKGVPLAKALVKVGLFPTAAEKIIEAGEKTGSLETLLLEIAAYYENDIEYRMNMAVAMIEPTLILVTGIIVGGIVVMMYLPIFNLASAIS